MIVQFEYSARDFEESAAAQKAFFAKRAARKSLLRGLLGWIVFVVLAIILVFLLNQRGGPARPAWLVSSGPAEAPTQNFLLTLIPAVVPPLLTLAWLARALAKPASLGRVPLYIPAPEPADRRRIVLLIVAWATALLGLGGIVAFCCVPSKPDWTPNGMQLFLVHFLPWIVWSFAAGVLSILWQKRAVTRANNPERSTRLPQQMEVGDAGITIANTLLRQEFTWGFIVSYLESENLLLLFTKDLTGLIVPKRAFADEATRLQFFSLLHSRVPAGKFLPRESAFPIAPSAPVPVLPVNEG